MSIVPTITRLPSGNVELRFPPNPWLTGALKVDIPGNAWLYDPPSKTWTIVSAYVSIATRLMLLAFQDAAIVDQSGPGAAADRGHQAADDPYTVLHLLPTAPPELVAAAHRVLAMLNHPDRGGSTVVMQQINAAVGSIREAS